jgi:predicted ATP-grasp superfamily ATP-dependent carboligase
MRVLVYEFVTGGGWHSCGDERAPDSLVAEGSAMLRALAADLVAIDGVEVDALADRRHLVDPLPYCSLHDVRAADEERHTLKRLAAAADWTVVIAPEFAGHLAARVQWVEEGGGRVLGPGSELVALAADKHRLAEHLAQRGVSVPPGVLLAPREPLPEEFAYPAVLKPLDGAGSQGLSLVVDRETSLGPRASVTRLEQYCAGAPASVACLCGDEAIVPLAACAQLLSDDGRFRYLGGRLPLDPNRSRRAQALAVRAVASLPSPRGYLGVDLVLGDDPSGCEDVVIEINPRLTTSYVGLRALADGNLAAAMLAVASGGQVELCWREGSIQFEAAGHVRWRPQ